MQQEKQKKHEEQLDRHKNAAATHTHLPARGNLSSQLLHVLHPPYHLLIVRAGARTHVSKRCC